MPPNYTQSVRNNTCGYYYTATCGAKFTSLKAAWHHHDPSGVARRVFDEAKEAAKEAAKRVSKGEAAAWEAARPAREQGSGLGSGQAGQGSGLGSGQAGQGSGMGSGQAGQGSGHVEYEHREWRRDMLR
jgi:hypothetical protein